MIAPPPALRVLLGPQTKAAHGLNDLVRENAMTLANEGFGAFSNRFAARALRNIGRSEQADREKNTQFIQDFNLLENSNAILSPINFFGPPEAAFRSSDLFPDAERVLAMMAPVFSDTSMTAFISIEPLHDFFFGLVSDRPVARVASTKWEALYELGWSDLVSEVVDGLPETPIRVITPGAIIERLGSVTENLFGPAAHLIDVTELARRQKAKPNPDEMKERTGIDVLTATLLEQRFSEDLDVIASLPNVVVL